MFYIEICIQLWDIKSTLYEMCFFGSFPPKRRLKQRAETQFSSMYICVSLLWIFNQFAVQDFVHTAIADCSIIGRSDKVLRNKKMQ